MKQEYDFFNKRVPLILDLKFSAKMTPVAYEIAHFTLHNMLNPPIYGMLCFALSVLRTRITKLTFLMFYGIGD